jgi:2-amino-4-hydroxy-6-hydroxymethyldihydropteridine diphosphokinase
MLISHNCQAKSTTPNNIAEAAGRHAAVTIRNRKGVVALVNFSQSGTLLLALGGNAAGPWGTPRETLVRVCRELEAAGIHIVAASRFYETEPVGGSRQPRFLNAVLVARSTIAPAQLLRLVKRIERRAGRKTAPPLSARPADIDVLDFAGRRLGFGAPRRERGRLILPHPLLHTRAFVLVPLAEVAPHWLHPVIRMPARAMLARLSPKVRSGVRQALDFRIHACENAGR